jgi:hypothetical protein
MKYLKSVCMERLKTQSVWSKARTSSRERSSEDLKGAVSGRDTGVVSERDTGAVVKSECKVDGSESGSGDSTGDKNDDGDLGQSARKRIKIEHNNE